MELRHLRYFTAVAEELNFRRAAERLHIAQPPLSQQIRNLEDELGLKLFHRTKRHVELTEPGRMFLEEARVILQQVGHAVRTAVRTSRGEIGRLVVGFVMSATCSVLPEILRVFRERYPGVELVLEESTTGGGLAALKDKKMHLCFLRLPVRDEALSSETVLRETLVLAIPQDHHLSKRTRVPLRLLADESFILFPRSHGPGFHDQIVSLCHQSGFSPRVVQEASQMQTILSLVAAGIGVALIPASVQNLRNEGVHYKPIRECTPVTGIALAWLRDCNSPVMHHFIAVAREVARSGRFLGVMM
jgi:DNA-binding transcriptional LysR family regulator